MKKDSILYLESGIFFTGSSFGYDGEVIGEIVFNTSMTGYQEIITDPSYNSQIVLMTYPHIGNYGTNEVDIESNKSSAKGIIAREFCDYPSNFESTAKLSEYLIQNKIVGISNIDTRKLTKIIRNQGSQKCIISNKSKNIDYLKSQVESFPVMEGNDLTYTVTCKEQYSIDVDKKSQLVFVYDFGCKKNILEILSKKLNIKSLLGYKPMFGICLGHQLLSLSLGFETFKLRFGHRGANHPVMNLEDGKVEITSQNHGFAVKEKKLNDVQITQINLNDKTVEGIFSKKFNCFSVQYHPEASPGPHDSYKYFEKF